MKKNLHRSYFLKEDAVPSCSSIAHESHAETEPGHSVMGKSKTK